MPRKKKAVPPAAIVRHVEYLPPASQRERKSVVIDRELSRIYDEQGVVSVDAVLVDAADPKSPLHSYFEWDNEKAAEKYRRVQAYSLIMASKFVVQLVENGSLEVKRVKESGSVRRLVSAFRGEGFKMRADALGDEEMRKAIVESKKSALRSWCRSVIDVGELDELRSLILANL